MPIRPPEFDSAADALAPLLVNLPGKLIAIDGRDGVGKTTLGRFLAWYFNVSLVEADLFLQGNTGLSYLTEQIGRIIALRLAKPRPVIIEGVAVLKTLQSLGRTPDFLIYVTNSAYSGGISLSQVLDEYEDAFKPKSTADLLVHLK